MSIEQETPFWLVWSPKGERPPKYRHFTVGAATTEAERLARLHPGQTFVVLQSVAARTVDNMVRTVYGPNDSEIPF